MLDTILQTRQIDKIYDIRKNNKGTFKGNIYFFLVIHDLTKYAYLDLLQPQTDPSSNTEQKNTNRYSFNISQCTVQLKIHSNLKNY